MPHAHLGGAVGDPPHWHRGTPRTDWLLSTSVHWGYVLNRCRRPNLTCLPRNRCPKGRSAIILAWDATGPFDPLEMAAPQQLTLFPSLDSTDLASEVGLV